MVEYYFHSFVEKNINRNIYNDKEYFKSFASDDLL